MRPSALRATNTHCASAGPAGSSVAAKPITTAERTDRRVAFEFIVSPSRLRRPLYPTRPAARARIRAPRRDDAMIRDTSLGERAGRCLLAQILARRDRTLARVVVEAALDFAADPAGLDILHQQRAR